MWTVDEWDQMIRSQIAIPIVSIVLALAIIVTVLQLPRKEIEKFYLLAVMALLSFIASMTTLIITLANTWEQRWCYDNSISYRQEQGYSPCLVQGVILSYCFLATAATIFIMSVHQYVLNYYYLTRKSWATSCYGLFQVLVILVLPGILVAMIASQDGFGFPRTAPWCYVKPPALDTKSLDLRLTGIPALLLTILAVIIVGIDAMRLHCRNNRGARVAAVEMTPIAFVPEESPKKEDMAGGDSAVVELFQPINPDEEDVEVGTTTSRKHLLDPVVSVAQEEERKTTEKEVITFKPVSQQSQGPKRTWALGIFVLLIFVAIIIPYVINKAMTAIRKDMIQDAFQEWVRCVFNNYEGSDEDYLSVCGSHPSPRSVFSYLIYTSIILSGNMIIAAPLAMLLIFLEWRGRPAVATSTKTSTTILNEDDS